MFTVSRHTATRIVLVAALVHQMGLCGCLCPEHNEWLHLLAHLVSHAGNDHNHHDRVEFDDHLCECIPPAPARTTPRVELPVLNDLAAGITSVDCGLPDAGQQPQFADDSTAAESVPLPVRAHLQVFRL